MAQGTSPYSRKAWRALDPVARQLIAVRFLRSIAQGALAVDFTLYLYARHWGAAEIGLLLMGGGLAGALLSIIVGVTSDRVGRRGFLIGYEIGLALGTVGVILDPSTWLIALVAALFGFGRGANGASGPFAPAEQAWLAQTLPDSRRGTVFSLNAGLQFWGMGIGSLLAAVLPHLLPGTSGAAAYLPLFFLNLLVAVVNLVQIAALQEAPPAMRKRPQAMEDDVLAEYSVTRRENKALMALTAVNMINSLGVGLIAPLLPYWFAVRFGVGPEAIGPVYGLTFFLTGASSLVIGRLSERIGLIRSIVLPRVIGVALLVAIPFVPTFWAAASLYVVRSILNRGSVGARQAFSVGLVRDQRRGLASSLNAVSWNVPAALGPALAGVLIGEGQLFWPFLLAAALQFLYIALFPALMGRYESRPPSVRDSA